MIGRDTVDIIKRTTAGGYDTLGTQTTTDTTITITGCSFQIDTTTKHHDIGTTTTTVTAKVYLPITADTQAIDAHDAIQYRGRRYECQGPATIPTDLDGTDSHVKVQVKWSQT